MGWNPRASHRLACLIFSWRQCPFFSFFAFLFIAGVVCVVCLYHYTTHSIADTCQGVCSSSSSFYLRLYFFLWDPCTISLIHFQYGTILLSNMMLYLAPNPCLKKKKRQRLASCNYKVRHIMCVYHTELFLSLAFASTDSLRRSNFNLAQ